MRQNEVCIFNTYHASCDPRNFHVSVQFTLNLRTALTDDRWRNADQPDTICHLTQLIYPLRNTECVKTRLF